MEACKGGEVGMTDFQIALVMFYIGWSLGGIFIALIKFNQITNRLDEILKAVKCGEQRNTKQ
jgi:hypothetical protein